MRKQFPPGMPDELKFQWEQIPPIGGMLADLNANGYSNREVARAVFFNDPAKRQSDLVGKWTKGGGANGKNWYMVYLLWQEFGQ